jgi:hypothetical protein
LLQIHRRTANCTSERGVTVDYYALASNDYNTYVPPTFPLSAKAPLILEQPPGARIEPLIVNAIPLEDLSYIFGYVFFTTAAKNDAISRQRHLEGGFCTIERNI